MPQAIDTALFNFVNQSFSNPLFDRLMPLLSGNRFFLPAVVGIALAVVLKYRARGWLCLAFALLAVGLGDGWLINSLKQLVARPRPFNDIESAITLVGRTGSFSFPSAHAANSFAVAMVCLVYFRASARFLLPLAFGVAFSRVYNGVHYPSDVAVGALLGTTYGLGLVWAGNEFWQWAGRKWFPLWWRRMPSLLDPEESAPVATARETSEVDGGTAIAKHWLRLGYVLIAVLFVFRLAYLASGKIELSEDEAYQWQWSRHLALSYFSKPPLIAYTQFLGTSLWGDTAFGVRFFSPVIAAVLGLALLRFLAGQGMAREGFWLIAILGATPMPAVGTILMVIDSLSVLFWTLAMLSGWRAVREDSTRHWLLTGVWLGLGCLAKYTALFQLISFALFLMIWAPARRQIRRPGCWLALAVIALSFVPVLVWNAQHDWITLTHLGSRAGLETAWRPTLNFLQDFVLAELALLNPVFCVAMIWAVVAVLRRHRDEPLPLYLLCMGAPLFAGYLLYTLRARVQPNWIAPSIVPLFALMVIYWSRRWEQGSRCVAGGLKAGLLIGIPVVVLLHDTNIPGKVFGAPLPAGTDPLTRVRGWNEAARLVAEQRSKLRAEGREPFVIGAHYGITSVLAFYLPGARVAPADRPVVYYQSAEHPENQYYFWPGYREARRGEDAIYVQRLKPGAPPEPPPERLVGEFHAIEDLGVFDVTCRGRVIHQLRMLACRNLR